MSQERIDENLKHVAELKAGFPDGPWQSETDREDFRSHGLPCFVLRNLHGAWCGYVGVPPGHPAYGKGDNDTETADLQVHGGITYAAACSGHLCHVPEPGEPDAVWWFGFDCVHAFDLAPGFIKVFESSEIPRLVKELAEHSPIKGTYRDLAFVRAETESLAAQLAAIEK